MALPAETPAMVLLMIVAVGLVVGVMAPMTPKGAGSVRVRPLIPGPGLGLKILGTGGLFDHQEVLLDLVLGPAEPGFAVRHLGQFAGVLTHHLADASDDPVAGVEALRAELEKGGAGGGDGRITQWRGRRRHPEPRAIRVAGGAAADASPTLLRAPSR